MPNSSARPNPTRAPGFVRIIGGRLKRSRLPVPNAPGLRPTPDRVRETLFNWLGQDLTGLRCLDLFAGSGALGLEAASRGASAVDLVERDPKLARSLDGTRARLGADNARVHADDALRFAGRCAPGSYDVAFVDPPYSEAAGQLYQRVLAALDRVLAPGGVVYLETPDAASLDVWLQGPTWQARRHDRAGQVHYALLQRSADAASG